MLVNLFVLAFVFLFRLLFLFIWICKKCVYLKAMLTR